jgi:tetratricopeptide (TPR) repeat protein
MNNKFILKLLSPYYLFFLISILALIFINSCASLSDQYISEGLAFYDSTYYKQAEEKFLLAIAEDSTSEQGYFNLGRTRTHLQAYRQAVEDFSRVVELNPSNSDANHNRAIT